VLTTGPEAGWKITRLGETEPFSNRARARRRVTRRDLPDVQPRGGESSFTIVTFDGHVVRVRDFAHLTDPADYFWTAVWIDDGVVALRGRGIPTRTFVWNIFSDPVELPVAACILGGR
jgi:hypothetical protein